MRERGRRRKGKEGRNELFEEEVEEESKGKRVETSI